jgi:hypothetical protein
MKRELSSGINVTLLHDVFQGRDDAIEAGLDLTEVGGQAEVTAVIGVGDEDPVRAGLLAMNVEELGSGLEVRTGQAGIRMRTFLLGRAPAVTIGKAVADA